MLHALLACCPKLMGDHVDIRKYDIKFTTEWDRDYFLYNIEADDLVLIMEKVCDESQYDVEVLNFKLYEFPGDVEHVISVKSVKSFTIVRK